MRPKKTKNLADVVWAEFQRMSNSKEDAEALGIITKVCFVVRDFRLFRSG